MTPPTSTLPSIQPFKGQDRDEQWREGRQGRKRQETLKVSLQVPGQEEQEEPLLQVHVQREGRLQGPQQQEGQEGEEGGQQEQEQIIETRGATAYLCKQCVCHFHIIILCLRYFTLIDIPLHINFLFNYTVFIRRIRSLENKHLDKIKK